MSEIYYREYELTPRAALNSRSGVEPRKGALIRIGGGHGCIHPWPELGDAPLDVQLQLLREGKETPLIAGAKECAAYDGRMRREGKSLPAGRIPESHWLVRPGDDPEFAWEDGFRIAKIKGSPSFREVREEMNRWIKAGFRIRLDFNESLEAGAFLPFWNTLSGAEKEAIEFVEDPEQHSHDGWSELRRESIPIAVDRDSSARLQPSDILVMKPARPDWCMNQDTRYLITSYMDHAIGQMWAAHKAAAIYGGELTEQRLACGLLTHRCYEDDEFFERMRTKGPRLMPVEGTGLGFDDLLEKLPWKRLN